MPHLPLLRARGVEGLMPGFVQIPVLTNPVTYANSTVSVGSDGRLVQSWAQGGRVPHMGELIAARFVVPQNPVRDYMMKGMGGCGCGCGGGCGGGMGAIPGFSANCDPTSFSGSGCLSDITSGGAGIGTYVVLAGLAFLLFAGGSATKGKYRAARAGSLERKSKRASAAARYYRDLEAA